MIIKWSRNARADQQRIWLLLAQRSAELADRVEALVEARAESLARYPGLGRPIEGASIRRLSATDVQYVIDYRIEEDAIRILGIRSTRENREER